MSVQTRFKKNNLKNNNNYELSTSESSLSFSFCTFKPAVKCYRIGDFDAYCFLNTLHSDTTVLVGWPKENPNLSDLGFLDLNDCQLVLLSINE